METTAQAGDATAVAPPTRTTIEKAISAWWSGGGKAREIVDALLRLGATASEARAVAERLAERVSTGYDYISFAVVEETLERVRAVAALEASRRARAIAEDQDALRRAEVWRDIEAEVRRTYDPVVADRIMARIRGTRDVPGIYAGLGSEVLRTQWRSLLAEDLPMLTAGLQRVGRAEDGGPLTLADEYAETEVTGL